MIQIIAMVTMVIDHIGAIFYPDIQLLRIIGRIAFPLYSWFLVQGYIHTRNHKKYMLRLLVLASISQIPFTLALQRWELNVIFTLLVSLIGLFVIDRVVDQRLKTFLLICIVAITVFVPMDYGIYGFSLILIMKYTKGLTMIGLHMLLNMMIFIASGLTSAIQMFSILGTLFIAYPFLSQTFSVPKWIYRSFYPAHLAVLSIISLIVN